MKRYLLLWLTLTGAILLVVAVFNTVIDPYGLFHLIDKPGFNITKPKAGSHGAMSKAYQVLRVQPQGLVLGNSRAEVGLDPEHPAWPANSRPVFNLALPGTGTETSLRYLQHVLANTAGSPAPKPRVVILNIDFMDFLVDANTNRPAAAPNKNDHRLLTNPDGSRNPARVLHQLKDYAEATLTLSAFLDSLQTVASQGNAYSENLTPLGFNPMRDYLKITADEGYWAVFRQRDIENIKAYARRPNDIFDAGGRSSRAFEDLRQIISLCQHNDIVLHLVIYPYHAHLLEIFRITGHWQAFENWKREVVSIAESQPGASAPPVEVWDFSGFNALTMEGVPASGDRKTQMHWYWEAGHFKRELGNLMLARIFGQAGAVDEFGVLLNTANIEQQIAAVRTHEIDYRHRHAYVAEELECLAAQLKSGASSNSTCKH